MADKVQDEALRKRDVPWHRNGILMKYAFMLAGVSMVFGAYTDPRFAMGRPGLIDAAIGFVLGSLCGKPVGSLTARRYDKLTRERVGFWQEMLGSRGSVREFGASFLMVLGMMGSMFIGAYAARVLHLGFPWFNVSSHEADGGAAIMYMVFSSNAIARGVERWYAKLPD